MFVVGASARPHALVESPSSRGLGRGPFKAETRVRIPVGTPSPSLHSVDASAPGLPRLDLECLDPDGWSWLSRSPSVVGFGGRRRNRPGGGSDARPPFPSDVRRRQEHDVSGSRGGVPVAEPPQPHRRQSRGRRGGSVHRGDMDGRGLAISVMTSSGWTPKTYKPGDPITVVAHPNMDGSNLVLLFYVIKADGTRLYRATHRYDGEKD